MSHRLRISPVAFIEQLTEASYQTLFGVFALLILAFGLAYFGLSYVPGSNGLTELGAMDAAHRFANAIYFSVVTATTVGYGDVVPHGLSRVVTAVQALSSFPVLAIFVAKIASSKQEIALREVHRLSYESNFYNTTEGLFIIRRDFDAIMTEGESKHDLSEKSWEDLLIAFQKGQSLMEDILDFYNDHELYTIDSKREKILAEAVYRTLRRIRHLITALDTAHVGWRTHENLVQELREFLTEARNITLRWQEKSPHPSHEWFRQIVDEALTLNAELGEVRLRQ